MAISVPVVSIPDLYGGKIVAALDRQHPRDLFDTKLLLENEGLTDDIIKGFLIHLSSHTRPIHEVLFPSRKDMKKSFEDEFEGMTNIKFDYKDFEETRDVLTSSIQAKPSIHQKDFLLSLQNGSPNWTLLNLNGVNELPAVKWKIENLKRMTPAKRSEQFDILKKKLGR